MKVIIVGAGASGVVAAINYKRNHQNDDVLIIEHLDKPLKKILATGNGKCNLGNSKIDYSKFNNPEFAKSIIEDYNYEEFFDSISIKTKLVDTLAYPISESAVSVREALLNELRKNKIKLNVSEKLIDYTVGKSIKVVTDKKEYEADKLYLAGGLFSSPKLGSDGSIYSIIEKHGYKTTKPNPGLSPLYTIEKTKSLDGVRCKSLVKVSANGKTIFEESGEVLFKDHGLSGIVIFNAMSVISRSLDKKCKITLDLLPDFNEEYLKNYCKTHTFDGFLLAFINPKISEYLKERFKNENEIIHAVKNLEFTFDKSYGFDFSQVSVGGIEISEVDNSLMSKHEKNVYFIGELLNIDGPCGGYNLTWAFASAIKSTKSC